MVTNRNYYFMYLFHLQEHAQNENKALKIFIIQQIKNSIYSVIPPQNSWYIWKTTLENKTLKTDL